MIRAVKNKVHTGHWRHSAKKKKVKYFIKVKESEGRVKWVKGAKYVLMEGNKTSRGEHAIKYADDEL